MKAKSKMKTTKYLYNLDPKILAEMNYEDAIKLKIVESKKLLHYLVHEDELFIKMELQ